METLFQLCDWDIFRRVRNWDILERFVDEEDQIEAFNSIATDIDENAKYCAWHRRTSCDEYFRPIITNEGRCFTFVTIHFFISLLTFSIFLADTFSKHFLVFLYSIFGFIESFQNLLNSYEIFTKRLVYFDFYNIRQILWEKSKEKTERKKMRWKKIY